MRRTESTNASCQPKEGRTGRQWNNSKPMEPNVILVDLVLMAGLILWMWYSHRTDKRKLK